MTETQQALTIGESIQSAIDMKTAQIKGLTDDINALLELRVKLKPVLDENTFEVITLLTGGHLSIVPEQMLSAVPLNPR